MRLTNEHLVKWILKTNEKIQENKMYLTDLDQAIGDGDHGINIARGFDEAVKKITNNSYATPFDLIKDWAMTLLSKVGGASGPLFGTALLKLATAVKEQDTIDYDTLTKGVEEGLNGIILRGQAQENQKTMLDVWYPVVRYLKNNNSFEADDFVEVAKTAMESTKDTKATKGRAAYLSERSIGHLGPGSVSSFYLFSALAEVIKEGDVQL